MITIYTDTKWEDLPRWAQRHFPKRYYKFRPWSEIPALWFWMC